GKHAPVTHGRGAGVTPGDRRSAHFDGLCSRGPGRVARERPRRQGADFYGSGLRGYRNDLRASSRAAHTASKSRGNSQAREQIAAEIRALPGVKETAGIDDLPLSSEFRQASRFVIEGQPIPNAGLRPIAQFRTVSLNYFSALGIPLREGRLFTEDDWKVPRALINETMARRFWPKGDALGKRINLCSLDPKPCWSTIVGVVGNVHQFG